MGFDEWIFLGCLIAAGVLVVIYYMIKATSEKYHSDIYSQEIMFDEEPAKNKTTDLNHGSE